MEIYQVEEGDKYVTYSSLYEQWSRTESENSSSSSGTETDFFQSARAEIEDFTLERQGLTDRPTMKKLTNKRTEDKTTPQATEEVKTARIPTE